MNIVLIPHLPTLYGRRYNLAKSLVAQGHTVHFIVWDNPYGLSLAGLLRHIAGSFTASVRQDEAGFTIHKVRRLPLFMPFINGLLFKWQIRRIYARHACDIILSQSFTNETEPPLDLPIIYDMNDDHAAFAKVYGSALYKLAYKLLTVQRVIRRQCTSARMVTVVSDRLLAIAGQYNNHVVKIPNGVEESITHALPTTTKPHSVVYVSTFGKWAHGADVVAAIGHLQTTIPGIHLDLIGDGTEMPAIRQKVAELHLEQYVTIHGWIRDRRTLFNYIASADVCLNISEKNSFRDAASPMKVIDYSALGKKIVSTGLDEVQKLHLPNVFIYDDTQGTAGLQKALLQAFETPVDAAAVQGIIRSQYTWTVLIKKMFAFLEQAK